MLLIETTDEKGTVFINGNAIRWFRPSPGDKTLTLIHFELGDSGMVVYEPCESIKKKMTPFKDS